MLRRVLETLISGLGYLAESRNDTVLNLRPRIQLDGYSCGLQSLTSVLRYYGISTSTHQLADRLELTTDGCDENAIRKTIKSYGLRHRTHHRMSLEQLRGCIDREHPVLVPVNGDRHWSVVHGYGPRVIYLMDPAPHRALLHAGQRSVTAFSDIWDHWGIEIYA